MSVQIPARVAERAATKYVLVGECWETTYARSARGYGQIGWQEGPKVVTVQTHRASWVYSHGQIPEGLHIDHLCGNPPCVNPLHMELVTPAENARRGRRTWTAKPVGRKCGKGHLLVQVPGSRQAYCRTCSCARKERFRAKKRKA